MNGSTLHDDLVDLAPRVQREHRFWWRGWSSPAAQAGSWRQQIDRALCPRGVLADVLAAALVANWGTSGARCAIAGLCDGTAHGSAADPLWHAVQQRLERPAARLHELVGRIDGPLTALAAYLAALWVVDGSRPGGRVWLEDLAEALLLPPVLIRQLQRGGSAEPLRLAASA